jgi:hypothetical protein
MLQNLHERGKPQVRDLAAPQGFHALEVQGLQADGVVLVAEVVGKTPMKGMPYLGDTLMDTSQMRLGTAAIAGTRPLSGQFAVRLRQEPESLSERLWGVVSLRPLAEMLQGCRAIDTFPTV